MEGNFLKKQEYFTDYYRFAEDLVKAVIEILTVNVPSFLKIELGKPFITNEKRGEIQFTFSRISDKLDDYVRTYTNSDGLLDYSDQQFLLCVVPIIEEYKHRKNNTTEKAFLSVCSLIASLAASFLSKNAQSDAINVSVDSVYDTLIDTFYPPAILGGRRLIKDISDRKYQFAYDLVKTLLELWHISVPELKLPTSGNFRFTDDHKNKIKAMFGEDWTNINRIINSFVYKNENPDYSDENFLRCIDKIEKDYGSEKNTKDECLLVSARVAYASAMFLKENYGSNAMDLAVDRIHQMTKNTIRYNKYEQNENYRFSCDLVKEIVEMRSHPLSVVEMSHSDNSFFLIAHQNKIEYLLSREKHKLDKIVTKFKNEDGNPSYNDNQFLLCMDQIADDYKSEYKSTQEIVLACTRIAYVAAYFWRKNNRSNAPRLAVDRMLEIAEDMNCFSNSKEEVKIRQTQDDHYRFAYDLVKAVFEMRRVPVFKIDLPDPDHFLFTAAHRNKMEMAISKEKSRLDKMVKKISNLGDISDYSDGKFIRCMSQIIEHYYSDQKKTVGFDYACVGIAYTSASFLKKNPNSNASFLAVNRIYEMIKVTNRFSKSTEQKVLIVKAQDEHYHFAYVLTKTVLDIKRIPLSALDLPDPDKLLFTEAHRNKIQMLLSKRKFQLDQMVEKISSRDGRRNYSDNKFIQCMDQIVQDYKSDQNPEEFVHVCTRIAYMASAFLIGNCNSNATFLAVNRMYEMSKDANHLSKRRDKDRVKDEDYHFTYDLVKAAFEIRRNLSFTVETSHIDDSPLSNAQRNEIHHFLSKEWPLLHGLVRRFTGRYESLEFGDDQFLEFIHQIINNYESEQKSEAGLLLVCARIAYVATCFLRKNPNSNASDLAVDIIYQMRTKLFPLRSAPEENYLTAVNVRDDKYRFSHDLVRTVMELQNTPIPDAELPDPDNFLFTSQHRKKIIKFFRQKFTKIEQLLEKLTNIDGNLDYSNSNFLRCMDHIFEDYEKEQMSKAGFVLLCAMIAYPTSRFVRNNSKSNAITLAINRIHAMVKSSAYFNEDSEDE